MTRWEIKGREFGNCNCSYGCPCQFNALPTYGNCRGLAVFEIDEGYHGTTRLDGLRAAAIFRWPGPIHEGKGEGVHILDKRATAEQRAALLRILQGEDTEPGATVFQVFSSTCDTVHEPIIADIEFELDVDGHGACPHRWRPGNARCANPQPDHRGRTSRAHRAAQRFRICHGRDRPRLVEDRGPGQLRARRHLRPVCSHPSLPERHGALSGHDCVCA